jgi:hypothetical protein
VPRPLAAATFDIDGKERRMNSGGHRGFTVVTIVTLIFSPVFVNHHWLYKLTGRTTETEQVACAPKDPCPARKTIVEVVMPPLPDDPPRRGGDDGDRHRAGERRHHG